MSAALIEAARAVVERWDTPLWKDVPATAVYINALRTALAAAEAQPASDLVITNNDAGQIVAVTRQDADGRILEVLAEAQPVGEPVAKKVDRGFRWDGANLQHIPSLTVEFEPVPANGPCDAKGWADRDAVAAMLAAPPAQPAAQPLTDEQIDTLMPEPDFDGITEDDEVIDQRRMWYAGSLHVFARAIERAHGIGSRP